MAVPVAVMQQRLRGGRVQEEVPVQRLQAAHAHEDAAREKHARDAQGAQALDLAKSGRVCVGRRSQAEGHGREGQDVGGEVGHAVPCVRDHGLGVEEVAADELCDGHPEVGVEPDAGDAHAGVVLVL